MTISEKVKEERMRQGITQNELAEMSGVSLRTIQRIENPTPGNSVRLEALERVDTAFWINTCYRLHGARDDVVGEEIWSLKKALEYGEVPLAQIRLKAMNFKEVCKSRGADNLPDNVPGFEWHSILDEQPKERGINTKAEHDIMVLFRRLNSYGQEQAIGYLEFLTHNPDLIKT